MDVNFEGKWLPRNNIYKIILKLIWKVFHIPATNVENNSGLEILFMFTKIDIIIFNIFVLDREMLCLFTSQDIIRCTKM